MGNITRAESPAASNGSTRTQAHTNKHKHTWLLFTHQIQVYLFNLSNMCNLFFYFFIIIIICRGWGEGCLCVLCYFPHAARDAPLFTLCCLYFTKAKKKKSIPCTFLLLCSSFSQSKSAQGPHRPAPLIALLSTAVASLYRPLVTPLQILALSF